MRNIYMSFNIKRHIDTRVIFRWEQKHCLVYHLKNYGAASRRQARWRQIIHHSALPKPRVSAFKFDLICSGRLLPIFMFVSCCASAWLLIVGSWASEQGVECALLWQLRLSLISEFIFTLAFCSYITHA